MIRDTKLLLLAALGGSLATTPGLCQSWEQTGAPSNSWQAVACSADGNELVAAAATLDGSKINGNVPGPIYISTNSGATWTQTGATNEVWNSVASSADGTKLAAVAGFDGIYMSTNSGDTWFLTALPAHSSFWSSFAFSADGTRAVAAASSAVDGPEIYTSTNSGVDWTPTHAPSSLSNYWNSLTSSADGRKLAVVGSVEDISTEHLTESIYISTNSGITWVQANTPNEPWSSVIISVDGSKLVAEAERSELIFTSTNSGADWTQNNFTGLAGLVSSVDQTKLVGVTPGAKFLGTTNQVFRSTDSGLTWNSIAVPPGTNGFRIASSSADGNRLFAIANGYIYVWEATPPPPLNLAAANANLTLSWIIPSTNFVLQQSSDLSAWADSTNVPILNFSNLQNQITLPQSGENGFYRLKTE